MNDASLWPQATLLSITSFHLGSDNCPYSRAYFCSPPYNIHTCRFIITLVPCDECNILLKTRLATMNFSSLLLAALLAASPALAKKKDDAVLLSKVKSLTLRDGQRTSHRRVDPLPQLNCVGGDGCQFYKVDTMRCTNSGSEYDTEDIQWTCKASLPPEFKLGSTDVICEGYDNADDPYILKGSCGVEYRLMLTEFGEEKYRDHIGRGAWRSWNGKQGNGGDWLASVLFWLVFACEYLADLSQT